MDTLINNKSCVCKTKHYAYYACKTCVCVYALSAYHQEVG